jgi:hypothetical protein
MYVLCRTRVSTTLQPDAFTALTRQRCSQGLWPWTPLPPTPTFSCYALVFLCADLPYNVLCKNIAWTISCLLRVYNIITMTSRDAIATLRHSNFQKIRFLQHDICRSINNGSHIQRAQAFCMYPTSKANILLSTAVSDSPRRHEWEHHNGINDS